MNNRILSRLRAIFKRYPRVVGPIRTCDAYGWHGPVADDGRFAEVLRLEDHMTADEFADKLGAAYRAPKLTEHDADFLASIDAKFDEYGDRMFFSEAQRKYLQGLAVRGGWRPSRGAKS